VFIAGGDFRGDEERSDGGWFACRRTGKPS
jgi:hypothetical protein